MANSPKTVLGAKGDESNSAASGVMDIGAGRSFGHNKQVRAAVALVENHPSLWVCYPDEPQLQRGYLAAVKILKNANLLQWQLVSRRRLIEHIVQKVVLCPFDRPVHVLEDMIGRDVLENAEVLKPRHDIAVLGKHKTQLSPLACEIGLNVQDNTRPCAIDLTDAAQVENQRVGLRLGRSFYLVDKTLSGLEKQCALQFHDQDRAAVEFERLRFSDLRDLRELIALHR